MYTPRWVVLCAHSVVNARCRLSTRSRKALPCDCSIQCHPVPFFFRPTYHQKRNTIRISRLSSTEVKFSTPLCSFCCLLSPPRRGRSVSGPVLLFSYACLHNESSNLPHRSPQNMCGFLQVRLPAERSRPGGGGRGLHIHTVVPRTLSPSEFGNSSLSVERRVQLLW